MTDSIVGRHAVAEALRAGVPIKKVIFARGIKPAAIIEEIQGLAGARQIPIQTADRRSLGRYGPDESHQGVVALSPPFAYASFDELVSQELPRLVLLDGVTDPVNLGSVMRTSDAFGWNGIILPSHRSVAVTPTVRKVAAGAADRVPVAQVSSAADAVSRLKRAGIWVVGLDPSAETDYRDAGIGSGKVCLVLGAEGRGLSRLVKERSDALVSIPMKGTLASVNVAVAAAVVMVEVTRSGS